MSGHRHTEQSVKEIGERLSTEAQWAAKWQGVIPNALHFDPNVPMFSDLHRLFRRVLPSGGEYRFLEIGAYPGYYMWYFQEYFGYEVNGVEYVESSCSHARRLMAASGVRGTMILADAFDYAVGDGRGKYDVVASFGFAEHFDNQASVMSMHMDLLRPGGQMIVVAPNHQGWYGSIMKWADESKYSMHNCMGLTAMTDALDSVGGATVLAAGYAGRFGFWHTCIYETFKPKGPLVYTAVRGPLWILERAGRLLPNSALLSPTMVVIAEKK